MGCCAARAALWSKLAHTLCTFLQHILPDFPEAEDSCDLAKNGIQGSRFSKRGSMHSDSTPRTLILAAHPDDETIGAAIKISRSKGIQIVHVTDGSPLNTTDATAAGFANGGEYALARRQETERALALAGVPQDGIANLGFTDQQTSFQLEELTSRVVGLLERLRPEVVLTHSYEGGHPDHDSVAFACHLAKKLIEREESGEKFELVEFTGYHADSGGIIPYEFLPHAGAMEYRYQLAPKQRQLKLNMIREFKTQAKTLAPFMDPQVEALRQAPHYDFRRAPHSGRLFYEYFNWGIDGATWRDLARDAERKLLAPVVRVA